MKTTKKLLLLCTILLCSNVFSQPLNDNCADAFSLTVGSECISEDYTSIAATAEDISVAGNPSCGFYQGSDVWFSFVVPTSGNFRVELSGNYYALYEGSCGSFTELFCSGQAENFVRPDLSGNTLYIRAFRFNSALGNDLSLCVWEIDPPANNDCSNATSLTLGSECISQDYSTKEATSEDVGVAANPSCGLYKGGDTWFTFDVPASGNFRLESSGTQYALYTGTCGNLVEIDCNSGSLNYSESLLGGQTIYLRTYRFNSSQGSDYSLCVWEFVPQPNDFCADAIEMPVLTECSSQNFSSTLSTAEDLSVAANPSCGLYKGGDTWFTFEVPASGNFRLESSGTQYALYTGTCGNFVEIDCNSGSFNYGLSLLGGQTIYLRAYRFNSSQGSDFSLCIWEYTPQPNDLCANATEITVQSECNTQAFSTTLSTTEDVSIAEDPNCGLYKGGDTWFTFDVPVSGQFRIDFSNAYWVLYQGNCGDFEELVCETGALNFNDPSLAGETLYLRAFRFNSHQGTDFDLCIWEIDAPSNDMCFNATELSFSDTCLAEAFSSQYSTAEDLNVSENPSCGIYKGGDIWFQFQAPPMGNFTINRPSGSQQFAFYTGSCGMLTEILCESDSEIIFNDPSLGGETIFIRAYRFSSRQGSDFELCILTNELSPNDDCSNAIDLPVSTSTCNFSLFGSYNATDEMGIAADPTCGQYQGDDVWFSFVVPADGKFAIRRQNVVGNFGYSLYTGTCGNFGTQICASNPQENIYDNAALAGQTIYLRAYNRNSTVGGIFGLCVAEVDCNNTIDGTAFFDNCDDCVGGTTGIEECVPDCNGVFGGIAFIDECDDCVGGATGLEACVQDCNGDFGGMAFLDNCATCVEGNTGLEACLPDCNGDFGGTAFFDTCEQCVEGNTGQEACCPIPFPALDESSLTTAVNATNVALGWESTLGQVGCQVQLRFANAASNLGSTIVGGGSADSFTIPGSVLQINEDYEWRVRCGCSETPIIAGPFTSWQPFSTAAGASITASPNPVVDNTTITVSSDVPDHAVVAVFDLNGRQVAQLYTGEIQPDQSYRLTFDASGLANGVYLCRYTGQSKTIITKIMVAR